MRIVPHVGRLLRIFDASDVLRVTRCHFDDLGADLDELSSTLLPTTAAFSADGHRDLVIAPSRIG